MVLFNSLLQFLFPEKCLSCGTIGVLVCEYCLLKLPPSNSTGKYPLASYIHPIFDYKSNIVRKTIWRLKYSGNRNIATIYSEPIYDELCSIANELYAISGVTAVVVTAIPIASDKRKQRGYNQSELLMHCALAHSTGNTFSAQPELLSKKNQSIAQAKTHNRSERLLNIRNSFFIKDNKLIKGQHIIIVDDVVTTGATLSEARKVLIANGARSVHAVTIAH